jgi:NitT/TauT family transport system substrate-binding protein
MPMRSSAVLHCVQFACAAVAAATFLMLMPGNKALAEPMTLRVGHFPNITHAQALIAHGLSRQGRGWFEQRLGPEVKIEWFVYNAGPSAMEAIFADSVDLTYVGPAPTVNAYSKARGEDIRVVAGAVEGGEALLVQPGSNLRNPADFRGKKIGTPQLGNTQDVAARAWLAAGGLKVTLTGGDASVIPTANPDQLGLFQRRELDAVWTVEPWVSRLELEANAGVLVEDKHALTTVLVASAKALSQRRELVRKFVAAHEELTEWIREHPEEAKAAVREELTAETRSEVKPALVAHAWPRIVVTSKIAREPFEDFVKKAKEAGFLRTLPDLSRLVAKP